MPEPEAAAETINRARAAGLAGGVISLLAQRLPGAKRLEEVLAGKTTGAGLGRAVLGGAAGEAFGEVPEEVGGKLAQNVALRTVDPTQSLTAGLGETAGMAALAGAGLGGLGGGVSAMRGTPEAAGTADAARQQAQQRILEARERERVKAEGETPIGAMGPYMQEQYGQLEQEKQQLMQGPQAPNVKERIAEITKQQKQMTIAAITRGREEKAQQESEAKKAAASAFSQPEVRETPEGQGELFSQFEAPQARVQPETLLTPAAREAQPLAPSTLEKYGQRRLGLRGGKEGEGLYKGEAPKAEAPKAEAGITGTTQAAIEPLEPIAPVQPVSEPVPEPTLAPKRVVPPELQPVIDSLTAAGVRPETKTWAENGRNRPFLRKLVSMSVMAPEARQAARKALKLEEGSHKAEAFDALFPAPRVPAFEPAAGAGKPSVGIPSKPRPVSPAEPTAAGAGETVRRGVVPVRRTPPTPAAPEGGAKPALEAGKVTGFTTAKGSTYEVTPEGQTIRTKKSPGRGQGETSEPHTALYVSPKASESILEDMQGGMGTHSVRLGYATDTAFKPVQSVAEIPAGTKPAVGVFNKKTGAVVGLYEAETAPRIGLSPVEKLYSPDGTSSTHIGNKITQVVEAGAKPEPTPKKVSLKEAEAAWEDNNVEGAGTRLAFKDLSPERKKIWKDSVEDGTATIEEYERLAKDQADIVKAEKRKAAATEEAKRATEEAEAAEKKAQLAAQIRDREQAKRDKAEAKRKEEERVKAEREAEAKAKAEAAAARERAKREAIKPDVLWNEFNDDPNKGRFLPFKKLLKRGQREWETAVANGTADIDTYRQIAGAQLKADSDREAAKLNAILESSVATAKRRMAEAEEAAPKAVFGESDKHPEWATKHESSVGGRIVYSDEEGALLRGFSVLTGQYVYTPVEPDGRYRLDVDSKLLNEKIPAERLAKLREAKARLVKEEAAKLAKYPDGPFTGATGNVVASDGVDARYAGYLTNLMQDLGLGDIRVFLLHPEDVRAKDGIEKYRLYADWAAAQSAGLDSGENGSIRVYGTDRKSFYIALQSGMSEQRTIETLSHELGHLIQRVSYDTAPSNVQKEVRAEYEQWLVQTKGKTARELIQSLRNRETAAAHAESVSEGRMATDLSSYWTSFSEWFADNVSKWATTDERPVSVVEKFFKSVADKLRALVSAVTGRDFAPAKTVASFLDKMGPANPVMWAGTTDTKAQQSRAPSPTEGIAETSELMKEAPGEFKAAVKDFTRIFTEKDDVSYVTRFRTEIADSKASVVNRMNILFDGGVRDELTGINNPERLIRQAEDPSALFTAFMSTGGLEKDPTSGRYVATDKAGPGGSIADMLAAVKNWSDANGMDFNLAYAEASKLIEARRLDNMRQANEQIKETAKKAGVKAELFPIHKLSQKDDRDADEQIDAALRGLKANPEIQAIADMMDKQRAYMIDHMVAVGRISKETAQEWKDAAGYVPFDRVEDFFDKYVPRRTTGRGITQLGSLPKFVGSTEREVGNVLNNHVKLMGWMLTQTLKQDAGSTTLNLLADMGQARRLHGNKLSANNAGNVVRSYKNGREEFFEMRSRYDVKAFLDAPEPKLAIIKLFAQVSNILRKIVTVMPPFIAKQVTDDIQRGFVTSGVKSPSRLIIPAVTNFLRIAGHEVVFGKDHPFTKDFAKKGLGGNIDYNANNPAETVLFSLGYSKRGWLNELHHRLESITRASDLAMRKAIYDRTMVEENKDVALATARAQEFINFRRRGASTTINLGVSTVPFFNAYLQSSDLLLRSMVGRGSSTTEKAVARRLFWTQAAKMTGFALIYSLANSDDEEYKKQTLADRSNNWIIGGKTLPVPGDMAAMFKVPVEVLVQYMARQGTEKEQLTSEAVKQVLGYAYEQFVGRVTPVPQAIRPVAEALMNHSLLTGRELVGTYQQGMPKPLQTTTTTSELAKAIATFAFNNIKDPVTDTPLQLSPVIIDNYARGYLGGVVPLMNMLIDQLVNPNKTDRPLSKYWFLSQYLTPEVPTGPKEEFYDLVNKVMPVKRALAQLEKTDMTAAMAYYEKNKDNLLMAELVNKALQEIEQTRAYIKYLDSAEGAKAIESGAERLKMKQEVERYENKNLEWVRAAKAQIFGKKE